MTALEAAHDYVRRGWGVVPLHGWDAERKQCRCSAGAFCATKSRAKHPSTGRDWQKRALTSSAGVDAWYAEHPHDNVGVLTGPASGIFVFDVDGAAGIKSVTDFAAEHGAMPPTRIVRTGSGGLHYFFRHPGHFTIHNSTGWLAPGIDIRGQNGQVVAPPSISSRGSYELIADHAVAEPPEWLLELLREHTENYENGRTASVRTAEPVDVALMPEKVRTAAATLVGEDQGRFKHFHHIVASCREAGYSQGQTVTIVAPWCSAVDKFVGRIEAEVARCWGKLEAADAKAEEWLSGVTHIEGSSALDAQPVPQPEPTIQPDTTEPTIPDLPPTWAPVNLEPILDGSYTPEQPDLFPRTDSQCLVYPGRVHSFHGESESGKSLVVQAETARLIQDQRDCLYIDFESDAAAVVGRLLDLGCDPDDIRTRFTYLRPDNDPRKFAHEREHFAAILDQHYAIAVIDGMTDALGVFGAGTADNDEISDFMRAFPRRLATRTGAAVIVVDHVTKDADSRGRFAVGGQAKMNALDGSAYMVEVVEALGRGMKGAVSLRVAKDRPGGVRPHCGPFRKLDRTQEAARVVVDSTGGGIVVTVEAPHFTVENDPQATRTFRPTVYMQRISDFLEAATSPVSQTVIEDGVGGTRSTVRKALAVLVAEGHIRTSPGPRRATLHELAEPYSAHDDPDSDTYVGWTESDPVEPHPATAPDPADDPAGNVASDRAGPVPSPTGDRRGQRGGKNGHPAGSAPNGQSLMEVACEKCFRPTPEAVAKHRDGLCGGCAREAGLVV